MNRAALKRGPARDRSSPDTEWLSRPGLLERDRYSMIGRRVGKWAAGDATRVADPPDGQRSVQLHETEHSFASRLVMAGVDLRTVQELGGWKTLGMVQRYARLAPVTSKRPSSGWCLRMRRN